LIFVSKIVITLFLGNCVVRLSRVYYEGRKGIFSNGNYGIESANHGSTPKWEFRSVRRRGSASVALIFLPRMILQGGLDTGIDPSH
jgi:hypothetical protein